MSRRNRLLKDEELWDVLDKLNSEEKEELCDFYSSGSDDNFIPSDAESPSDEYDEIQQNSIDNIHNEIRCCEH